MAEHWSGQSKRVFVLHRNGHWIEIYDESAYEYEHAAKCDDDCYLVVLKSEFDALADSKRIAEAK